MKSIETAKEFSNQKIELLRKELKDVVKGKGAAIITCGSFARREASTESDYSLNQYDMLIFSVSGRKNNFLKHQQTIFS